MTLRDVGDTLCHLTDQRILLDLRVVLSKNLAGKFPNDDRQWQTMVEARDERQKNIAAARN
jgi:hypothetical protein